MLLHLKERGEYEAALVEELLQTRSQLQVRVASQKYPLSASLQALYLHLTLLVNHGVVSVEDVERASQDLLDWLLPLLQDET